MTKIERAGGVSGFFRARAPGDPAIDHQSFERRCLAVIGRRCQTTLPGHELHLVRLDMDQHALRLEYEITPPLPRSARIFWGWSARDDLGNEYLAAGGAFGPSPDREATAGVLSLTPLLHEHARSLTLVLEPEFGEPLQQREWIIELELATC
jgi:hypothetical protein